MALRSEQLGVSPGTALVGGQKKPSKVPTPKSPWGRTQGSKNKDAVKTQNTLMTPGKKARGRPKKEL